MHSISIDVDGDVTTRVSGDETDSLYETLANAMQDCDGCLARPPCGLATLLYAARQLALAEDSFDMTVINHDGCREACEAILREIDQYDPSHPDNRQ